MYNIMCKFLPYRINPTDQVKGMAIDDLGLISTTYRV